MTWGSCSPGSTACEAWPCPRPCRVSERLHPSGVCTSADLCSVPGEIEKRKADTEGKAKLNLAGCGLTDRDVLILVDVLVECRVISKLELRRNAITETGAQAVLTLLKEQQLFMQTNALADRAHCTFLAHVDLDSCNGAVSPGTLSAIKHVR